MARTRQSGKRTRDSEARRLARADRLYEDGAIAAADTLYRQVLERNPENVEALSGRAQSATTLSEKLSPASLGTKAAERQAEDLCFIGGECYVRGLWPEAIACYGRALDFDPESVEALWGVADSHASIGEDATAIKWFRRYLEIEPDEPEVLHMLAALGEMPPPERASDAYVVTHFDRFAESFDHQLVDELQYCVPELLLAAVEPAAGPPAGSLATLDLGCGTGLCAPVFHAYASRLDGVDLSANMIREARARQLYDKLSVGEIGAHLAATRRRYELILAADVLIYLGALDDVFRGAASVARDGALFAFSAEACSGSSYRLMPSGRYAHARSYIRRMAKKFGWREISHSREAIRHEYAEPVEGDIWLLEKTG